MLGVQILILIAGLALVIYGADFLVDGASSAARRWGVSEFVIGLTIVGFGTSCPELVVSLTGAFAGNADISIGNVIGSNIFNTLLILGITAILSPIAVTSANRRRDIPLTLAVSVLFVVFALSGNVLTRIEGGIFLLLFASYLYLCFKTDGHQDEDDGEKKEMSLFKAASLIVLGLAGLVFGGKLFVESSVNVARAAGVSDKFIAITLLAGGTSLPELATCVVAAAKKRGQLALGNILGSNVFNVLLILGLSSVVTPLGCSGMDSVDFGFLAGSAILLTIFAFTGRKDTVSRVEGCLLLLAEAGYMYCLISNI